MAPSRRVAITGLGAVTPIGNTVEEFWSSLVAGRSGAGPITQFDVSAFDCKIAAEVKGFEPEKFLDPKLARKSERFVHFAIVSAMEAWKHAGLSEMKNLDPAQVGCVMGVGIGGIEVIEESRDVIRERGPDRISPFIITRMIANMAPGQIAIELGLKGPNLAVVTACAAGTNAIGEAGEIIRRGAAKVMIAGGTESAISSLAIAGFAKMKAICTDSNENPSRASRPFDSTRAGFMIGEGAGALILEDWEFARSRGAKILAELAGYGLSSDAYHVTAPAPGGEGAARSMEMAIAQAGIPKTEITYINAHGTSTPLNDQLETEAVKTVFGEHARNLAMSSNKSMIGHLLGAAGGVEAVATVKTLTQQILPPTINYQNPDPACDLDYVPNVARRVEGVRAAISNSLGFGGHNSTILIALTNGR